MDIGLNSATAFYLLGMIFGLFSILYFGMEVILEISPVVKSIILLLAALTFFAASGLISSKWRNIPLYFLASVSYLIFVLYTLARFDFGSAVTFLILAGSSAAFLGAGYLINEKGFEIPEKKAKYLVVAGVLLILGVFLFDVAGPQAEMDLQLRNNAELNMQEETAIGTLQVTNDFVLPRGFEAPNYRACTVEGDPEASLTMEREGDTVGGGETLELELNARIYERGQTDGELTQMFEIKETDDCVRKEGQISVFEPTGLD